PALDRRLRLVPSLEVLREHFRLHLCNVGKSVLQSVGYQTMDTPPCRARHRLVGSITHEGMLEDVAFHARGAARMRQTGVEKLAQVFPQLYVVLRHHRSEELVPKLAPESSSDLRRLACRRRERVEPRCQEVAKARGNLELRRVARQGLRRGRELTSLHEDVRYLLDEEWHAIGSLGDKVDNARIDHLSTRDRRRHHGLHIFARETCGLDDVEIVGGPWRVELGTRAQSQEEPYRPLSRGHPGSTDLLDQQSDQFDGRRVAPVQVFHREHDGPLLRHTYRERNQGGQHELLLTLGCDGEWRKPSIGRVLEEARKERHRRW